MGIPKVTRFLCGCASLHDGVAMIGVFEIIFSMFSLTAAVVLILLINDNDFKLFPDDSGWENLVIASNAYLIAQSLLQIIADIFLLCALPKKLYMRMKPWIFISYMTVLCVFLTSTIDLISYAFNDMELYGVLSIIVGAVTLGVKIYFIVVVQSLLHEFKESVNEVQLSYFPQFST